MEKKIFERQPAAVADAAEGDISVDSKADLGLQFITRHGGAIEYTAEEDRRVRWKLDLHLMPIVRKRVPNWPVAASSDLYQLMITFGLQYLDKVTITYAALYDLRSDLNLHGQQYSWAVSLFYFGYLVGEFPANFLLQKLPIGKFASAILLIWGAIVMLCAVTTNFAGLAALRFLMGFFEAGIPPCWIYITGMFYKSSEQGARTTGWYFMVGVAAIVGGLLGYGVGHINTSVKKWQFVFLICGGFTVLWAGIVYFFLPDSPLNARFLTERERAVAVERVRQNRTGIKTVEFKWSQAAEALRDPQVWMFAFYQGVSQMLNIGGSFLPLIIKNMGFTGLQTTLLTLPVGGVECVAMVVAGGLSSLVGDKGRCAVMFVVSIPTLVGCSLLVALPQSATWGRITGVWLLLCIPAAYAILLSLISSNVAGTTKKTTTMLLCFVFFCIGNIVSPQLFISTEAPRYDTGLGAMLVGMAICLVLNIMLAVYYIYENRRRDGLLAATSPETLEQMAKDNEEFLDKTDFQDSLRFRYRW